MRADAVLAVVDRQAELHVRVDGVEPLVLQRVRADLVADADTATLVAAQVHQHSAPIVGDQFHRRGKLVAAVATQAAKHVAREAFAVHAGEQRFAVAYVAAYEREVLDAVQRRTVGDALEVAPLGWHSGRADSLDESFFVPAPLDQRGNRREQQAVLLAELDQLRQSGHRAVVVLNLADHAGGHAASESREIDGSFGVAGTLQHTALARAQRKHVAGSRERLITHFRVGERANRERAVGSGDSRARALEQVDRHGERRAVALGVVVDHHRQSQFVAAVAGERCHDHARRVADDERELLGGHVLRRHDQVALVLTVFVVDEHHHLAAADRCDHVVDRCERIGAVRAAG